MRPSPNPSAHALGLGQEEYDVERTIILESKGYRVLRFWNDEVLKNINGVMAVILDEIEECLN